MSSTPLAAGFCIVATLAVAGFQFALALGAPLGRYAWGGRYPAHLPRNARWASAASGVLLLVIAGHYASLIGWLPSPLDEAGRSFSIGLLTGFFLLGTMGNLASKSRDERRVFAPVTAALVVANLVLWVGQR